MREFIHILLHNITQLKLIHKQVYTTYIILQEHIYIYSR